MKTEIKEVKNAEDVTTGKNYETVSINREDIKNLYATLKKTHYTGISGECQCGFGKTVNKLKRINTESEDIATDIVESNKPEGYDELLNRLRDLEAKPREDWTQDERQEYSKKIMEFRPSDRSYSQTIKDPLKKLNKEYVKVNVYVPEKKDIDCLYDHNEYTGDDLSYITEFLLKD